MTTLALSAGVTDMLLQSHADTVQLLPALPSAVTMGSVKGLVACGDFVVEIAWDQGALTIANITSRAGVELAIRYMNGSLATTGRTCAVTPS